MQDASGVGCLQEAIELFDAFSMPDVRFDPNRRSFSFTVNPKRPFYPSAASRYVYLSPASALPAPAAPTEAGPSSCSFVVTEHACSAIGTSWYNNAFSGTSSSLPLWWRRPDGATSRSLPSTRSSAPQVGR